MKWIRKWGIPLINWLFPHYCPVCGNRLPIEEQVMCKSCLNKMPRTRYATWIDNRMARQFWGKFPVERAAAWFFYSRESPYAYMIHLFKYSSRKQLAFDIGQLMAREMQQTNFFCGIDCIIPVPLHPKKQRQRGYNQSELLARGVAKAICLPVVCDAVERTLHTETQTHKSAQQRKENMQGAFQAKNNAMQLAGKHVLLIDDVMTTSSTLTACADALRDVPDIKFSFLTVAVVDH